MNVSYSLGRCTLRLTLLLVATIAIGSVLIGVQLINAAPRKQSIKSLTNRRQAVQEEIARADRQKHANDLELETALQALQSISAEITEKQKKVNSLTKTCTTLSSDNRRLQSDISALQIELELLQASYLQQIKQMRLHRGEYSSIAFIFSARSLSKGIQRWRYMKQLSRWRRNRKELLTSRCEVLQQTRRELASTSEQLTLTLRNTEKEQQSLTAGQQEKQALTNRLKADNQGLIKLMERKRRELSALDTRTAALIEASRRQPVTPTTAAKAKAPSSAKTAKAHSASTTSSLPPTRQPVGTATSKPRLRPQTDNPVSTTPQDFAKAKGSLPHPVAGLFRVVIPYGSHCRPELPNITIKNTGIDVEVEAGAYVKSVYDGNVASIYKIDGFNSVILVKHGEYYTVYANLASVKVQSGQHINQGQVLGAVSKTSNPTLHFEIWKLRTPLNPTAWLK